MQNPEDYGSGDPRPASFTNPDHISLSITFQQGRVVFDETENSASKTLVFDPRSKILTVDPQGGERSRPFFFFLEFVAVGFEFQTPAAAAILWQEPGERPAFLVEPELDVDRRRISMLVVNASEEKQSARFELIPADLTGMLHPIDPTVVNNPDPPPFGEGEEDDEDDDD